MRLAFSSGGGGSTSTDDEEEEQSQSTAPSFDVRNPIDSLPSFDPDPSGANQGGNNDTATEQARQRDAFGSTVDDEPAHQTETDTSSSSADQSDTPSPPEEKPTPADTIKSFGEGLYNGAKNTAGAVKGAGEGTYNLATGKESADEVSAGAGRAIVNAATGGNAESWARKYAEQEGGLAAERAQFRKEKQYGNDGGGDFVIPLPRNKQFRIGGDTVSTVSSVNTAARVGLDAMFDSPTGVNVQDAGTDAAKIATQSDSKAEAAKTLRSAERGVNEFNKGLGSAYQDGVEAAGLEDNWFADNLDEGVGTGFEWFVADPVEGVTTATTGIDAETGETEARAAPLDVADAMLLGTGKLVKGARKGAKALTKTAAKADEVAKTTSKADEVAKTTSKTEDATQTTKATPAGGGLAGLAALGSVVFGGAKGARKMGKFSIFDEVAKAADEGSSAAAKSADEFTRVDEVASGVDNAGSLDTIDQFDSLSRSIGTGDEATRGMTDLSDTSFVMDEGVEAGARQGDELTSIDETVDLAEDSGGVWRLDQRPSPSGGTDDFGTRVSNAFNNVFSTGDEAAAALDEGAVTTVKAGDETATTTSLLDETLSVGDEATKTADESGTFADEMTQATDEMTQATDEMTQTATTFTTRLSDGLSRFADDLADGVSVLRGGDEVVRTGDEAAQTTTSLADEIGQFTRRVSDEMAKTGDEMTKTGDESGSLLTRATRNWWDNLSNWYKFGIPTGLAGGLLLGQTTDIGLEERNTGNRDPGPAGQRRYTADSVKSYQPLGTLYKVQQGTDETGWKTMGFGIVLGRDTEGKWLDKGETAVLGQNARPTTATPVAGKGGSEWVPTPRFKSRGAADDAYERFLAWVKESAQQPGDTPSPGTVPGVDGSLSAPDTIAQGTSFTAQWTATQTGDTSMSARLTLAIPVEDGLVALAESDMTLGDAQSSDAGQFNVATGWSAVSPGEYPLLALVVQNGQPTGALAKTTIEVTGSDDGDKATENSAWGDPQQVRELPKGWYLFAQTKTDGSGETRYLVVGSREDDTYIYVHPDGRARTAAHPYPTVEKAAAAFKKWLRRAESGAAGPSETPSTKSGRPQSAKVKAGAAATDEQSATGLVGRLSAAAKANPALFAGGTAATLVVGYYLHSEGYLSGALPEVNL